MYFDEVYFARSAEDIANHMIPKERTHPSFGKLVQTIGVVAFGETPFGWRIMGVIFGTLMVPLMFLLGKKLFGTWIGGFSAGFLFSFDFMHYTMSQNRHRGHVYGVLYVAFPVPVLNLLYKGPQRRLEENLS